MPTLLHHLLPLAYLLVLVSAASNPTSFCKCTCGANSTIIPLDAPSSSSQHNTRSFLPPSSQQQPDEIFKLLRPRDDDESPAASSRASTSTAPKPTSTPSSGGKHDDNKEEDRKEYRQKTCNDCNKQYCLSQHLHICEGVKSEDVFTTCFPPLELKKRMGYVADASCVFRNTERDSRKDEAVVFIFIFATAGLLGWAALKPWVAGWIDRARERRTYTALSGDGGDGR